MVGANLEVCVHHCIVWTVLCLPKDSPANNLPESMEWCCLQRQGVDSEQKATCAGLKLTACCAEWRFCVHAHACELTCSLIYYCSASMQAARGSKGCYTRSPAVVPPSYLLIYSVALYCNLCWSQVSRAGRDRHNNDKVVQLK